jgi:hypothetical protein
VKVNVPFEAAPVEDGEAGAPATVVGLAGVLATPVGEVTGYMEVYEDKTDEAMVAHGTVTVKVVVTVGIGMMAVTVPVVAVPLVYPVVVGYGAVALVITGLLAAEVAGGAAADVVGAEEAAASWLFTQAAAESV